MSILDVLIKQLQQTTDGFEIMFENLPPDVWRELLMGRGVDDGRSHGTITKVEPKVRTEDGWTDGSLTIDFEACGCEEHCVRGKGDQPGVHVIDHFDFRLGLKDGEWALYHFYDERPAFFLVDSPAPSPHQPGENVCIYFEYEGVEYSIPEGPGQAVRLPDGRLLKVCLRLETNPSKPGHLSIITADEATGLTIIDASLAD
jgi:hypothetical protein